MQCITTIILFLLQINNSSDAPSIADNRETENGRTITTIIDIHEWAIISVLLYFKRMTTVIRTRIVVSGKDIINCTIVILILLVSNLDPAGQRSTAEQSHYAPYNQPTHVYHLGLNQIPGQINTRFITPIQLSGPRGRILAIIAEKLNHLTSQLCTQSAQVVYTTGAAASNLQMGKVQSSSAKRFVFLVGGGGCH